MQRFKNCYERWADRWASCSAAEHHLFTLFIYKLSHFRMNFWDLFVTFSLPFPSSFESNSHEKCAVHFISWCSIKFIYTHTLHLKCEEKRVQFNSNRRRRLYVCVCVCMYSIVHTQFTDLTANLQQFFL